MEYNPYLYDISIRNLTKEKIDTTWVTCGGAQDYDKYNEFDVFYFNNPFKSDILAAVAQKIYDSHNESKCKCYFLNSNDEQKHEAFIKAGFTLEKVIDDPSESYFRVNVYGN